MIYFIINWARPLFVIYITTIDEMYIDPEDPLVILHFDLVRAEAFLASPLWLRYFIHPLIISHLWPLKFWRLLLSHNQLLPRVLAPTRLHNLAQCVLGSAMWRWTQEYRSVWPLLSAAHLWQWSRWQTTRSVASVPVLFHHLKRLWCLPRCLSATSGYLHILISCPL